MRYTTLAVDYDGTIAHNGSVDNATVAAMHRLRDSGRHLILVTGRELPHLIGLFPQYHLFEQIVAENGAVLFSPSTGAIKVIAERPPDRLIEALHQRGVHPLAVGEVVVATSMPHDESVFSAIRELGLEHQVVFNKGEIMVLPPGTNKGTGFAAALREILHSPRNAVAVGDAENDHAFLSLAECAVAVANALPMLKAHADLVTDAPEGAGVVEVIDRILATDLAEIATSVTRHNIPLGTQADGGVLAIPAYGASVLIAGSAGSGKSTVLAGLLERIADAGYQYCVVDPEGDHDVLPHGVPIGGPGQAPDIEEVINLLERSGQSTIVGLLGVDLAERPEFFSRFHSALDLLRANWGRPHWLAIDEAHHVLPRRPASAGDSEGYVLPSQAMYATVDPAHISVDVLHAIDILIVTGQDAWSTVAGFCRALGEPEPTDASVLIEPDQAIVWMRGTCPEPTCARIIPTRTMHRRHRRKYARGDIDLVHSFHFRATEGEQPRVARNLVDFERILEAIDDETWLFHLERGDFSRWFEEVLRDHELAAEARRGEAHVHSASDQAREIILSAIGQRYTLPS